VGTELSAVKLKVDDLQRASDFYVEHFAMVVGSKYNRWEWELRTSPDAGVGLILYCDPDHDHPYDFGTSWLLLRVEDARAAGDRLRAAGHPVQDPIDMPDTTIVLVFTEDLDGNIIELVSGAR